MARRGQSVLEQVKSIFSGIDPLPPGKIPPTVGLNIGRVRVDRAHLIFWDLGGARSLRSLWERFVYATVHPGSVAVCHGSPALP